MTDTGTLVLVFGTLTISLLVSFAIAALTVALGKKNAG